MITYTDTIRSFARKLLSDGSVYAFIGYKKGPTPSGHTPCKITQAADADHLIWDSSCRQNLAAYLKPGGKEKIGIAAKGCDSRNIVTHLIENRIKRDQLFIVGIPCTGMIDKIKTADIVDGDVTAISEDADGTITVTSAAGEKKVPKTDILQENCATCMHRNPVISDDMVADPVTELFDVARYAELEPIEAMTPDARIQFFKKLLAACTRCYACKNACPLCYCPTCFVDESTPQWVGKSADEVDTHTFHLLRAFHCAGRCTNCGACEAACPMGINMRLFTRKLDKSCFDRYGWISGLSVDERPPLDVWKANDTEEFIK